MTWILGAGIPFGYAALISDVRVVWPDGSHRDILQKVYPVGSWLMAGFAGSVEIGFALVADMQRFFAVPPGMMITYPKRAAWDWHRRGRRIFNDCPEELRRLGASVLLGGVSAEMNGPGRFAHCIRMRAPEFMPEIAPPITWLSIGTGTDHQNAAEYTRDFRQRFFDFYMQGEVMNPGGVAFTTASSVAMDLERQPMTTVSEILQVARVSDAGHVIRNLQRAHYGPAWSSSALADVPAGALARSWPEFQQMAGSARLNASAAAT